MNYQVVHSTVGRFRFRIPQLARDVEFAEQLDGLVRSLESVTNVRINSAAASLIVCYKTSPAETVQNAIAACIHKLSDRAIVPSIPCDENAAETEDASKTLDLEPEINHWRDLGMPCLSLSVALLAAPLELPVVVVGAAIAGAAMPWLARASDSLINQRQPNIDLLDSLWMTMQTLQGQFVAPALKTCLVEVRRSLRGTSADNRTQQALEKLDWLEQSVWVARDGQTLQVIATEIQVGDRVKVEAGDVIPVDGWVVSGTALVDESNLTGDSAPVVCSLRDSVFASAIVRDGGLEILAERTGLETRIGWMVQLIQSAPVHDTQIGIHQAEFVRAAIVPTIFLGGTVFALTGNLGAAISPFQFDFGSGIPISVHTTLLSALTYAAGQGICIRSARILELLSQVNAIVLDEETISQASSQAIAQLQSQGIAIYWITSEPLSKASVKANSLSIPADHVWADASSNNLDRLICGLQHQGKTVAAGCDSGNVSISFSHPKSSELLTDVVISSDVQGLVEAIAIAQHAMSLVYQNTAIIVAPNLLMQIGGGMFLGLNPVLNVIVNNSSAFVAEFVNGARPFDPRSLDRRSRTLKAISAGTPIFNAFANTLNQRELAKRLRVTSQALTSWRSKPDFSTWAQQKDPEGTPWRFDSATKCFYAIVQADSQLQPTR
ncbi:HMA2 domain-containing protein [Phormidesmis sp. 146-12]